MGDFPCVVPPLSPFSQSAPALAVWARAKLPLRGDSQASGPLLETGTPKHSSSNPLLPFPFPPPPRIRTLDYPPGCVSVPQSNLTLFLTASALPLSPSARALGSPPSSAWPPTLAPGPRLRAGPLFLTPSSPSHLAIQVCAYRHHLLSHVSQLAAPACPGAPPAHPTLCYLSLRCLR